MQKKEPATVTCRPSFSAYSIANFQCYDTISDILCQDFSFRRDTLECLYDSFVRLGSLCDFSSRAFRLYHCSSFLSFLIPYFSDSFDSSSSSLVSANFCRDRLCPICSWRRSLKLFGQVSQILDVLRSYRFRYLFLTLTVPSCSSSSLSSTLDRLFKPGLHDFFQSLRRLGVMHGFFRALEVTRNNDPMSKSYGLYHPHFHIVLAVKPDYFTSPDLYLNHDQWLQLWRDCYGDQTITQVDVRSVYRKLGSDQQHTLDYDYGSAVAEIAKYAVKTSDYIIPDNPDLTDTIVYDLATALKGRRLVSYGGIFRKVWQQLRLDDPINGDLLNLQSLKIDPDLMYLITQHDWSCGAYRLTDSSVLSGAQYLANANERVRQDLKLRLRRAGLIFS